MLIAVDAASPAVLLVASERVMCKVLHADLFYLWKIPLHINLCGGIHFLLAVVYWFVVGSGSITHEKGFSIRSFEEEWCSQVVHWGGVCVHQEAQRARALSRSQPWTCSSYRQGRGAKVFIRFLQPEVENVESWQGAEWNAYMSKYSLLKGYNFK